MPRYKYHDEWQISYQYDCHFSVTCRSLKDALWIAALKEDHSLIMARADCEHDGFKTTANVAIHLKDAKGKSVPEIFELFDQKVDAFIACRVSIGTWGNSADPT